MAINGQDLKPFIQVALEETIAQVRARLPANPTTRNYTFIVMPASDGRYIVTYWGNIELILQALGGPPDNLMIGQLPRLPLSSAAIDISSNQQPQLNNPIVVVNNGVVVGVLIDVLRGVGDVFVLGPDMSDVPLVLGDTTESIPATALPEARTQADDRVINAWVDPEPTGPLVKDQTYYLKFNVDSPRKGAATAMFDAARVFKDLPPEVMQIDVLVVLDTDDFAVNSEEQMTMTVPRQGKSKTITFEIAPKRDGLCVARALFFANGRMFQKMTISLQVGPVLRVESNGLTFGSAVVQPFRRADQAINLTILKEPAGYKCILQGAGVSRAFLNLSEFQIADWIKSARQVLYDIVFQRVDGKYVSQLHDTTIAADVYAENLKKLATIGRRLYRGLFYDSGDLQSKAMGNLLRDLSQKNELNVRIVAERFVFPWTLLYDGNDPDNPEPDRFWGFKHFIEYMPEFTQPNPISYNPQIAIANSLRVAFVCNDAIDAQFQTTVMADQHQYLNGLAGVAVSSYPTTKDLIALLQDPNAPPLIYFYCHAESKFPGEGAGVDDSGFVLTDRAINLAELKEKASNETAPMGNAPLVFVNACEGAELSPYLYDGLVPYLVQRGARGVIGTEVKTPVLFGAEFGKMFMQRFTAGDQPLGELLRDMRREYRDQKNNVLGLVYSLYSSGDVVVRRGGEGVKG